LTPEGDVILEPGEAGLTAERRSLATGAVPPDHRPQPGDPYKAAEEVFQQVLDDGGQEKHAFGAALNSVVNAAARGDRRVVLDQGRSHPDRTQSWER
jgi:hypothetical protein